MGLREVGAEDNRMRFESSPDGVGSVVDLRRVPGFWRGAGGLGTVHHVAFRAASDEEQVLRHGEIESAGFGITPVVDRQYFRSVYFTEPGGVLYEIATNGPGLMRTQIERSLPPLRSPEIGLVPA